MGMHPLELYTAGCCGLRLLMRESRIFLRLALFFADYRYQFPAVRIGMTCTHAALGSYSAPMPWRQTF